MHAPKVAIDECVTGLGAVLSPFCQAKVPFGVRVSGMGVEEGVLVRCLGLDLTQVAVEHIGVTR